jgi:UDP-arabinose 4-epimerase
MATAIAMGGGSQLLFGLKGHRWDTHSVLSKLYNKNWMYPLEEDTPENAKTIEMGGPYWGPKQKRYKKCPVEQKKGEVFQIHVLTMNRAKSLQRLLDSLEKAGYAGDTVELYIHIDKSDDNRACIKVAESFDFSHGKVTIEVAEQNNGLRNAWFRAWYPKENERAIILEDDIEVSPQWYFWLNKAWQAYGERDDLAGISLQRQTLVPQKPRKQMEIVNNHAPFLYRLVGSIGFSPHWKQWRAFLNWIDSVDTSTVNIKTPGLITSDWFDVLDKRHMWTQYFIWFCKQHDLYTLYVNLPEQKTLAAHMREKGKHFDKTEGRDFALATKVSMDFPNDLVKYGWDGHPVKLEPVAGVVGTNDDGHPVKLKLVKDGTEYGGWTYDSAAITADSVVYSVGLGEDTSWDEGIIKRFGLQVWGFDPTPKSIKYVRSNVNLGQNFHFTPEGLGIKKDVLTFTKPQNTNYVSMREGKHDGLGETIEVPVNSLENWMQTFGHTHLDILKIDIEGSEYDVLEHWIQKKWFPMDQLLVEFHQRFFEDKTRHNNVLNGLKANGFQIIHNKGGQEIAFRKVIGEPSGKLIAKLSSEASGGTKTEFTQLDLESKKHTMAIIAKAKEIHSMYGMVVLQILNEGYIEMTKSWICNVKMFPGAISHVMFITTDEISYKAIKKFDPSLNVYYVDVKAIKTMEYGQKVYWEYMLWRAKFLEKLLQSDVTILLTEADQFWFKNVVEDIKQRLSSKFDFMCLNDQCSTNTQLVNGGFQLLRSSQTLLDTWKAYVSKYEGMLKKYKSKPDTRDIGDISDQITLSNMIKSSSVSYSFLPVKLYVCGKYFQTPQAYRTPILVHNNWIKGNNAKISRAKKVKQWFLNPAGDQCNNIDSHAAMAQPPIIVTGVAGYIGSHAALKLLEMGHIVVGIDNLSRGSTKALDVLRTYAEFRFHEINLGDIQSLDMIMKEYKHARTVLHFAAIAFTLESVEFPELYKANITTNTEILVDSMIRHKIPQLVYSSSCSVYGSPTDFPITEETIPSPVSPYGIAKLNAEKYIQKQASAGNVRAHILRYFNVVGADPKGRLGENPRQNLAKYARLWTATVDTIFKRRKCVTLYDSTLDTTDGTAIRDYVHVSDLVDAHLSVLKYGFQIPVDTWNIGTGTGVSTKEFIAAARQVSGKDIPICLETRKESHNPPKLYASAQKLMRATSWRPKYVDIATALKTAWDYTVKL